MEAYVQQMLASPANTPLYLGFLNSSWDADIDPHTAALTQCRVHWTSAYLEQYPYIFSHCDRTEYNGMCFGGHFDKCGQQRTDDHLRCGFEIFDGVRPLQVDYTATSYGELIPLPDGRMPTAPSNPDFNFDLDPSNNQQLPFAYFNPDVTPEESQNWNSVELYEGEPDEVLGALLDTRTPQGNRSLRLNNAFYFNHVNYVRKCISVNSCDQFLTFAYAMVMQNPNHAHDEQPFMSFSLLSGDFDLLERKLYVSDEADPCFQPFGNGVLWQDWRCDFFDLRPYVGQDIIFQAAAADCGRAGHFGYGYLGDLCDTCCTPALGVNLLIESMECEGLSGICFIPSVTCAQDSSGCVGELPVELDQVEVDIKVDGQDFTLEDGEDCAAAYELLAQFAGLDFSYRMRAKYSFNCDTTDLETEWMDETLPSAFMASPIDIACHGVECIGQHAGKPTFTFEAMEANTIGDDWVAIESSIMLMNAELDLDYFSSDADYIINMGGYLLVNDPSLIGSGGLHLQGSMLVTNGQDTCPVDLTLYICCGVAIQCLRDDIDCEAIEEAILNSTIYYEDYEGVLGPTRTVYFELPFLYLQLGDCIIDEFTVYHGSEGYIYTEWWYPNGGGARRDIFNYTGPLPHQETGYISSTMTLEDWENGTPVYITIINNCGQVCIITITLDDLNLEVDTETPPWLLGEGKRLGRPDKQAFIAYPNPAADRLYLKFEAMPTPSEVILWNTSGVMAYHQSIPAESHSAALDVSDLTMGLYFIQLKSGAQVQTKYVVIQR